MPQDKRPSPGDLSLEDLTLPVKVEAGVDQTMPSDWDWSNVDSSHPNAAIFHISHSEAARVLVDVLRQEDCSPDANFIVAKEIPIVILDSLDKYWAGESKSHLPLTGVRVPVEGDTVAEAKRALADDLAAQLRLLLLLSSSHKGKIAPGLLQNLEYLKDSMEPRPELRNRPGNKT